MSNRIRELRRSRKLTQEQLADLVGATIRQIGYWENNKGLSTVDAIKIARIFNCSTDTLLGYVREDALMTKNEIDNAFDMLNDTGRELLATQARVLVASGLFQASISSD